MTNEFDELLRKRFDEAVFEPPASQWRRMAAALDEKPRSGSGRFWLLFSASALAATLAFALVLFNHKGRIRLEPEMQRRALASNPNREIQAPPESSGPGATIPRRPIAQVALPIQKTTLPKSGLPAAANKLVRSENTVVEEEKKEASEPVVQDAVRPNKQVDEYKYADLMPEVDSKAKTASRASFSLAGGINQGSLNTGYALGFNARTSVGKKFYVEGDIAYNNAGSAGTSSLTKFTVSNSNGVSAVADRYVSNVASLAYLQFAPSFGYKLTRTISVAAGADMQQMIKESAGDVLIGQEGSAKIMPELDYGVTGKTEVSIGSRLSAGLLYRQGINNMLHGGSKYFERQYLQVQLKFRVAGR